MVQKQDPLYGNNICHLQETHFISKDTYRQKVSEWKKVFYANGNQNKGSVAILVWDKIDFKTKTVPKKTKKNTT